MRTLDAIVIGSGQGGTPLSKKLAEAGYKTILIEKKWVGGTCVNEGCTPTKALIGHATIADRVRNSEHWGIHVPGMTIDYPEIRQHKQEVVDAFRSSGEKGIENTDGLELIYGEAVFTGHKTVTVRLNQGGTEQYTAERIFINAGSRPFIPDIPGLNTVPYLTSGTLLETEHIPGHLIIAGGSYIALEMGQLYRRLGSHVTIIERSPFLLSHEDQDVADCVKNFLQDEGIKVLTNTRIEQVEKRSSGIVNVSFQTETLSDDITGTHLLIATGRRPNTDLLRPEATGLQVDNKGYIMVNDYLETNVEGIYALGDIKGGPAFTHVAYNDYVIISHNLLINRRLSIKDRIIPYCMFTDPQLGRVGLTEKQARAQGIPITTFTLPMSKVARAIETRHTKGMMKAIVHADTHKILGAAIIGEQGGETMTTLQMAMQGGLTYEDIRYAIFAHPLYSESLNNLFMQDGR